MRFYLLVYTVLAMNFVMPLFAQSNLHSIAFNDLSNYVIDSESMVSAGQPNEKHFQVFKDLGVTKVIDLRPGDRTEESTTVSALGLDYYNVQVDWNNPTLQNFLDYVSYMKRDHETTNVTLTHCQLNWRGAVFTYLYRVTQLQEPESLAREHMTATWKPNKTWQAFIDETLAHFQK